MNLVSIPANPAPPDAVVGALKTPDGVNLRYVRWAPPPGRKGTVCIFQGRGECAEKYFESVRDLRARGFAVATLDWRGQGLSDRALPDRRKGYVKDFYQYGLDLDTFMENVVLPDCPPPLFAIAHSMGGAVLLRACHDGRRWFDRIVLSAPMIGLPGGSLLRIAPFALRMLRLFGRGSAYLPARGPDPSPTRHNFLNNDLTSDPVRYARNVAVLEAEPMLALGRPTVAWADAALRAMKKFQSPSFPASLRQPILMVAAGDDRVVSTTAIETFAGNLLAGAHLILPGSRHEILQEQDQYRNQFWAAFDAFVPGTPLY
jgi:lysophospholipase